MEFQGTPQWKDAAKDLVQTARSGETVAVVMRSGRERLAGLLHQFDATLPIVSIPNSGDQVEHVCLALGHAMGSSVALAVDEALRRDAEDLGPTLDVLNRALNSTPIVINGWDTLGHLDTGDDFQSALRTQTKCLRDWLAEQPGVLLVHGTKPDLAQKHAWMSEPLVRLRGYDTPDDLWPAAQHDQGRYAVALTALALGANRDEVREAERAGLHALVWRWLPHALREVVERLAVHQRPLDSTVGGVPQDTRRLGHTLGLWSQVGAGLASDDDWLGWVRARISPPRQQALHLKLAEAFAARFQLDDPSVGAAGQHVLEAHRHFVGAGEFERARQYARYGAATLIEAARQYSHDHQFKTAAHLYEMSLALDGSTHRVMPRRVRAYAKHYLHFNRAHGRLERYRTTAEGYKDALEDWNENALFWSRYVRVLCYDDRLGAALSALKEAKQAVPDQQLKDTVLTARTVRGLVSHGRLAEAIGVWGDYEPVSPLGDEAYSALSAALDRGWMTRHLVAGPSCSEQLIFLRDVEVRVRRVRRRDRWTAEFVMLNLSAQGETPVDAVSKLIATTRQTVRELVRAYTPDLQPESRFQKRRLLGQVDLVRSQLGGEPAQGAWVLGQLTRGDDGLLWLRTVGSRDLWFEIPTSLQQALVVDQLLHLAKVDTDVNGVAVGPVLKLDADTPLSDEELTAQWQKSVFDAG